jgi:hypothetical protein
MPLLASIVVKGKLAISTAFMVEAAKKVLLPTLAFPTSPTRGAKTSTTFKNDEEA